MSMTVLQQRSNTYTDTPLPQKPSDRLQLSMFCKKRTRKVSRESGQHTENQYHMHKRSKNIRIHTQQNEYIIQMTCREVVTRNGLTRGK